MGQAPVLLALARPMTLIWRYDVGKKQMNVHLPHHPHAQWELDTVIGMVGRGNLTTLSSVPRRLLGLFAVLIVMS